MRSLILVQSNLGKGHHSRVNAFSEFIEDRLIITKPFTGTGKDTEFFDNTWNDLYADYKEYDPDIIVTEGFPFGRYGWHPDFNNKLEHGGIIDILEDAKKYHKLIYSLDRDIPWSNPVDGWFHADILNKYYDGVIFHTDKNFIDPSKFIHNPIIDVPFLYTDGYVTKTFKSYARRKGILFVLGDWFEHTQYVYEIANSLSRQVNYEMTFIIGAKTPIDLIQQLKFNNHNILLREDTDGFRNLLSQHEVVVSNFGAGTFLDINITQTPAVIIPNHIEENSIPIYNKGGEIINQEQKYRAEEYEKIGNGKVLSYDNLNVATLMYAIEEAKQLKPKRLKMNGSNFVKTLFNNGESECMN